jgi:hypothetical protein
MIVDAVNGKNLDGYAPFYFVARAQEGNTVFIRKVTA